MKKIKLMFSVLSGNTIVIKKVDEKSCNLFLGKNIDKEFAKKLLVTSLKTLTLQK